MMADGGGRRLERELRAAQPRLAERIIFITGGATSDDQREFVQQMGARVLMKPFETETLLKLANRL